MVHIIGQTKYGCNYLIAASNQIKQLKTLLKYKNFRLEANIKKGISINFTDDEWNEYSTHIFEYLHILLTKTTTKQRKKLNQFDKNIQWYYNLILLNAGYNDCTKYCPFETNEIERLSVLKSLLYYIKYNSALNVLQPSYSKEITRRFSVKITSNIVGFNIPY